MSKHFSELMLRSAPELSWVESLMLSGVWLGTFALLRYGGAWALEGVVAMNTAVMFALWQQTALRPQKYKKKFLKQLFHSEPIEPRHQPTKHDDDGLSARERPFFNDFEDFAEVVNWRLANPHFGGGPWRLQEEAGSLFECRRSYAIFHNQARLGTLEVSAYDTQTPVLAHVQLEDVHLLSLGDIWVFFETIARYICGPDLGSKENFEARQKMNAAITAELWETQRFLYFGTHGDHGDVQLQFHGSSTAYFDDREALRRNKA